MAMKLALTMHILGTLAAGVLICFSAPYLSKLTSTEVVFNYIVLYALLTIWAVKVAREMLSGKDNAANELIRVLREDRD